MAKEVSHQPVIPFHPGEVLLEEFLLPRNVTQTEFAERLGWTRERLNELCRSLKVRKRLNLTYKLPPPKPATTVLGNRYLSLQHFGKLQMILAECFLRRELERNAPAR
jgi:hypothetical protein